MGFTAPIAGIARREAPDIASDGRGLAPGSQGRAAEWTEFVTADRIAAWDALAREATERNPFFESWYLLPALRALDPAGEVQLFCLHRGERLIGLMPIRRRRHYSCYPLPNICNWIHPNCFLGSPLVAVGHERAFWQALLAWAERNCRGALFLHLKEMPLSGPLHASLQEVLHAHGGASAIVQRGERALLASNLSGDEYRTQTCSKKRRRQMRRQLAKLRERGETRFLWHWDDTDIASWIEDFLQLEASGWKGEAGSAIACASETAGPFRESLAAAARNGKLVRLSLIHRGEPIAMLCNFVDPPASFGFKTAFEPRFAAYSPGVLLEYEYLATLDRDDLEWCDSCAAPDHPVMDDLWTARRSIGRLSIGIGGPVRQAAFRAVLRAEKARGAVETVS